jgi:hypothetical protein
VNITKPRNSGIAALLAATMLFGAVGGAVGGAVVPSEAFARDREHRDDRDDRRDNRRDNDRRDNRGDNRYDRDHRGDRGRHQAHRPSWHGERNWGGPRHVVVVRPRPDYYRPYYVPRVRTYNHVRVHRPYGRPYPGFGFHYRDDDALRFLGLTALGLVVFNELNEAQQRAHEEAFISATRAPIGAPILWNDGGRSGSVTAVREGQTADGRQCREFQQDVVIGGNRENAYGTACLQPDGSWEVVSN